MLRNIQPVGHADDKKTSNKNENTEKTTLQSNVQRLLGPAWLIFAWNLFYCCNLTVPIKL